VMKVTSKVKVLLNDERFQLIYGIFLIILIPLVIISNAIFIINRYNETIDVSLQRRGLLVGRIFSSFIKDGVHDQALLQQKVVEVSKASPDILNLQILVPQGSDFRVIASANPEAINQVINFYYYNFAWQQTGNDALATDSLFLSSVGEEINPEILEHQERFWLVSLPLTDNQNNKVALLSLTLSSQVVNDLANLTWRASLYSLALTILITILFLAVSTRLWGYATLYRKIKEVDQMKDEFIAMASHELRTPITAVKGYLSLILEGSLGKVSTKMKPAIEQVMASANRLAGLVEDLLDVSRIEQSRLQLDSKNIVPTAIIKNVVEELSLSAQDKKISLNFKTTGNIPKILVDADKLKQILINLIGNAIKYTEKGSVDVSCQVVDNRVAIRVKDTGIGIAPEYQKRLFEKFFRVKTKQTKSIQGTGLGLWITKQLVNLMKGSIAIESMIGTGTQVTITFLAVKPPRE